MSLGFPGDPVLWKTNMAPIGAVEEWIMNDRMSERAPYLSVEVRPRRLTYASRTYHSVTGTRETQGAPR